MPHERVGSAGGTTGWNALLGSLSVEEFAAMDVTVLCEAGSAIGNAGAMGGITIGAVIVFPKAEVPVAVEFFDGAPDERETPHLITADGLGEILLDQLSPLLPASFDAVAD
jgi:hypothetical protein